MAKKNHYYVLIFTSSGAKYVTSTKENKAYWNELENPKEFPKSVAEDIVLGLNLNGHSAVMVYMPYEICWQPYNYKEFECKFIEKEV